MSIEPLPKPSFSSSRRWSIKLSIALSTLAVLALVLMANYLGTGYPKRFQWSGSSRIELSPQTIRVLQSVTNPVEVTIFFNKKGEEELYTLVSSLLKEYSYVNPNVRVESIDYTRNIGAADRILRKYNLAGTLKDKNFIVFSNEGRPKVVFANELSDYQVKEIRNGQAEFRRAGFRGEMLFSAALFSVTFPHQPKAYFVYGHGEHSPENMTGDVGYGKFASILKDQNNVAWETLSLLTQDVPPDCQLLIIAGPSKGQFLATELDRIDHYLRQGGRLLVLMNNIRDGNSHIERLLARWGIWVENNEIEDRANSPTGSDMLINNFSMGHEISKPLALEDMSLWMVLPRAVMELEGRSPSADAPRVQVLAVTGENAVDNLNRRGNFSIIVAAEQGKVPGVTTERGPTRIVVVGDSRSLDNRHIESVGNHYFANLTVNWLLDRPQMLLAGLGPKPLREYQFLMTSRQMTTLQWVFLAVVPGTVIMFGGFVWLRRRS
jgi:ABC-type uncharacterized transport system involved in gliding motility auxiliary subunit